MEMYVKVNVSLVEGKQLSAELVGDELANELPDNLEFQVEDSTFIVDAAEIVDNPKARKRPGGDTRPLGDKLATLADVYMTAFPLSLGGDDVHVATDDELRAVYAAARQVFLDDAAVQLARDAQVRAAILKRTSGS